MIVRYEDLVLDTEAEMTRIMRFVLDMDNGVKLDSFWDWRIRHAISNKASKNSCKVNPPDNKDCQTSNLGSYKPRSSTGGLSSIGKSVHKKRYSEGVLLHMHEVAVSLELERKRDFMGIDPPTKSDAQRTNQTLLQRFGYDIFTQHFPEKLNQLHESLSSRGDVGRRSGTTVEINTTPEIRRRDDPFGRAMTFWRRGQTQDDTVPFPTVSRQ